MKEKKPINLEIGKNVKQVRENAGLTQECLAELIGLGVKHLSAIECGAVGVSLATLMEVRDELRRVTQNEMLCDWSMVWQQ